jgi:putative oxidoreductase
MSGRLSPERAPAAAVLIRASVGLVFLSEGIQKFLFSDALGVGRSVVAILSTKVPILVAEGFWKMAHEGRTDWAMFLGSLFLAWEGGGPWSIDRSFARKRRTPGG